MPRPSLPGAPLHVLVVPSWHPHRCFPHEGVFLREQALAIGATRPEWKVGLSLWRQGEGRLSLAHLRRSPQCVWNVLTAGGPRDREVAANVVAFETPALSWSESFLGGNREGLLAANRRNLERARRRFGRIDLLHAHVSYPAGWVAMRLSGESGIPYALTEHMGPFPLAVYARPDDALVPWIKEPLERADARIAVSPALCDRIAGFGIPRPTWVPNVVDERWSEGAVSPAHGTEGAGPFTFFTLCHMEPVKAIPDLLAAIRLLLDELPAGDRAAVRFRLGGDGRELARLRSEAHRLGLGPWVTWLGELSRDRAREEYAACDAFVLPSHHESFGVVLVEAASFGKPVIATRAGGPESIVRPETGLLVPPGDPPALAAALRAMRDGAGRFDPGLIRATFLREYSRAAVVDKLEAVYRETLGGRGA